jgi:hypothetical protein
MRRHHCGVTIGWALGVGLAVLAAAGVHAAQPTEGPRRRFTVVNAGPHRIRAVHVSPSSSPGWGDNLIGQGLLPPQARALQAEGLKPGGRVDVTLPFECGVFDVRFVAENGTEFVEEEVELCEDEDVVTIGKAELKRTRRDGSPAGER